MANGVVRLLIEAAGLGRVLGALRGVAAEARRADRTIATSARATSSEQARAAAQTTAAHERGARARIAAERNAAREATRNQRAAMREQERAMRESLRRRAQWMAAGSALAGGASALATRAAGYGGALGVAGRDEMVGRFISNEQRLIRIAGASRSSPRAMTTEMLNSRVNHVASTTNVDRGTLIGALDVAQNRFSRVADFADSLEDIARAASATGGADQLNDWVAAMGEFQAQLGTTAADVPELLGMMVDAMDQGSIEAGDVAANFSGVMNTFANLRGDAGRGIGGATEFMALAEASGGSGMSAEESRTRVTSMMSLMSDPRIRANIERATGNSNLFDESGRMTATWGELSDSMAGVDALSTPEGLRRVLSPTGRGPSDLRATQGFQNLIALSRNAATDPDSAERRRSVTELMSISGTRGRERIGSTMDELMNSTSGRALGVSIRAENNFTNNGEALVEYMTDAASLWSNLNTAMPLTTEALGTLHDVTMSVVAAMGAMSLATGGSAAGALAAGGGVVGRVATAVGGAGGIMSTGLGALAMGGLAGLGTVAMNFIDPGHAGGDDARALAASRAFDATETGAAISEADASFGNNAAGRTRFLAGVRDAQNAGTLNPETVRALAAAIGAATAGALANAAPADGRTPGEPGRR